MNHNLFASNFITATAYFIAGQAGMLLAIPPANAAAVWPAAGIALAALLISGPRILPGIIIGGILVQTTSFLDASNTEKIISSFLIGTVISAGAALQAWVGTKLIEPILKKDKALLKERTILLFCLMAGPISCTISASIGIFTLWFKDILTINDLSLAWSTWWIGDSIGVVTFTPIVLCFFGTPRNFWQQRITNVALPLCFLISIAFVIFKFSYQQEIRAVESAFERNATIFTNELENSIATHSDSVENLQAFFESSNNVTAEEFSQYTQPNLSRHPEIKALEWTPKILHEERETFEDSSGTQIRFKNQQGIMERSPVKELYFPIQFLEPFSGNETAWGYDIRNTPSALKATEIACASGQVTVTDALKLVQETEEEIGIVFYAPVYKKNTLYEVHKNCESLAGFVATVFRLENEIKNIHKKISKLNLLVSLKNKSHLFYSDKYNINDKHTIPKQFDYKISHEIKVANQYWKIQFSPTSEFITLYSSWTIRLIIVGGFLISGISGIGLLMLTGRTLRTEDIIKLRTDELNNEVKERKNVATVLALENKILEMLTRNHTMLEILDTITISIEGVVADSMSSILLLDDSEKHLIHGSAPNLQSAYIKLIDGIEIGPKVGSCGTAVYLNKQIIVSDIENDRLWEDFRDIALKHELQSCWSTPVTVSDGKVLGSLALYFRTKKEPNASDIDLMNRMANIVAITILRKQSEEKLTFQACHDGLTGLVNRHEFKRRTERLLSTLHHDDSQHALCFMDLDQFKIVNDTCGHTAGDELLRQLTSELQSIVRKRDTLARLGGDEFGVLMEHCSLDDAYRVATTLLKVIQNYQFSWDEHTFKIGASIGLVPITKDTSNQTQLLKSADAACYMAKELGRNRIHVYHDEDETMAKRSGEMQWVTRINKALENDRFCLYAQAIVPLGTSLNKHYELLIRMIGEENEVIPPGAFLPAAERYNLISKIDYWVINTSFDLLANNPIFLNQINFCSINLSGQSLTDPNVLDFIITKLDEAELDAEKICFEITETAAISNLSIAKKFISTLKGFGCRFALDDFGSGLSSFAYLKNLPVDFLKIDGMFVKDIVDDPIDHAMVKSINEIGQVMGMKTIAEFVENDEINGMLREIGVNYAQGYGIGKPQPLLELIENRFKR